MPRNTRLKSDDRSQNHAEHPQRTADTYETTSQHANHAAPRGQATHSTTERNETMTTSSIAISITIGILLPATLIVLNDIINHLVDHAQHKLRPDLWGNQKPARLRDKYRAN